uniref:hypothetical protein n=1 Tax=Escherichia coli TaxID=562 RepID=UPI001BC8538E
EKRVFLVILFTSFSGSLVSRIPGAVQSGLRTLSGSNHWDYAAARLKQERAAVGCYFFPEAENITTVP